MSLIALYNLHKDLRRMSYIDPLLTGTGYLQLHMTVCEVAMPGISESCHNDLHLELLIQALYLERFSEHMITINQRLAAHQLIQ